jgi:hypothetical protein
VALHAQAIIPTFPSRAGLFKRQESELVRKLAVFVFRVGNQFLMAAVHHPIQIFQRNLAGSKQRDGILPDERIGRGERQTVRLCLTDQHPVEGIAMQRGQSAQLRNGGFIQGQRRDEMFFALLRNKLRGRLRQGQFAKAVFDGDFPERNGTQEDLVVRVAYRSG